jgi:hypothetical protein
MRIIWKESGVMTPDQSATRAREIVATPDVVEAVLLHNRWGVAVYR